MALTITQSPSLAELTTLRLGGTALALVRAAGERDLESLPGTLEQIGGAVHVLGRGSNILARDGEIAATLVHYDEDEPEMTIEDEGEDCATVRVSASSSLPSLVRRLVQAGLSGLEGLLGVPGSVGGAVAMNAGAFGCEMGAVLESVRVFTPERGIEWLNRHGFRTAYRTFELVEPAAWKLVTAARIKLPKAGVKATKAAAGEAIAKKKASQPLSAWSAGCVYKNPAQGVAAGKLLDEAGFRGKALGGVGFSERHANFLVNYGKGTSTEAFELLAMAEEAVQEQSGYTLVKEVKVWPSS
ncbi:UDP-N-acetylenolpyruvoylglucosamine reductase [Oceanidesulfovibrio indonesiensis]|uniref:UDP-N-acetylenolpyruvoylglucosamine reductase n=1 Tax=Oceanidesulfovibrio indonesiensis TaxID=54767 RepID=A0A7M3MJB5_9BACT|nr:UDP-N-acetylmuramate dehydrogenase [Oceanidesulfovibrio indonesiensis]TVM19780.1 UDP-N-acetylenolpyruvoylglucosamine reductase [Oceanidesulfovibrio indonesiensis]